MGYFDSIYADDRFPHRAKAVYFYLRDRADAEGKCWPGVKRIAADLCLSCRTAQRALADLERCGYIKRGKRYRENGSRTSNLYMLV